MRKPPRYVTPAETEQIRALHAEGLTDPEIGERLGLQKSNVAVIRGRRLGLKANRKCHFWTGKERKQLIALASEGKSRKQIAAALGVLPRTVAKHLASLGYGNELDARRIRSLHRRQHAWDLLSLGKTVIAVAKELGLHEQTIRWYKETMPEDWGKGREIPDIVGATRL